MRFVLIAILAALGAAQDPAPAPQAEGAPRTPPDPLAAAVAGLRLRSVGPSIISGRIAGLAVDPDRPSRYFIAVASGGVWRTTNSGTTWTPVFDREGSYSIGYIVLDPKNSNVVWVGTGEN